MVILLFEGMTSMASRKHSGWLADRRPVTGDQPSPPGIVPGGSS
jgi:hypothetical protein